MSRNLMHDSSTSTDPAPRSAHGLNHRLVAALLEGDVGTFDWDVTGDRLYGDESFAKMFAVALDADGAAPLAAFMVAIHPDDRALVMDRVRHSLSTAADYECE